MCGIAGILDFGGLGSVDTGVSIQAMIARMSHRGPDANAIFTDDRIQLGHARLSIIDLSLSANQPFFDRTGRYVIVFNGEIYNYRELRAEIKDHEFKTNGDTEVLIEGYVRYGRGFLDRLKGMFAFAVWDTVDKQILLCRDRMGVKPLYYFQRDGCLVFASEIRSLLASGLVKKSISMSAVSEYLKYQSVSPWNCIIDGMQEVLPGYCMQAGDEGVHHFSYWSVTEKKDAGDLSEISVRSRVRQLFTDAVQRRLVSDVPVGAFLSGGIDSSAVVAVMSRLMSERPVTFNISFSEGGFDESYYARLIADKYNTDHHEILIREKGFLNDVIPALQAMDTPTGDGINTYVVSKAVKQAGLTVALSGVGGDELFAGYRNFRSYYWIKRLGSIWSASYGVRKLLIPFVRGNSKLRDLLNVKNHSVEEIYPVLRQVAPGHIQKSLLVSDYYSDSIQRQLLSRKININRYESISQYSIAEYLGYTLQTLLKDADQMSMAVSLELREPFFDHDLIEYVLGLPDRLKYPHTTKQLFVNAMGDLLPKEIVHRPKQGFAFPWPVWMRTELSGFCEEHLNRISERGFINQPTLKTMWKNFKAGDKSISWMELWLLVTLDYWMERNGIS
jgi:asparagine synthase (glutamine-hydrolysing)